MEIYSIRITSFPIAIKIKIAYLLISTSEKENIRASASFAKSAKID